MAKKSKLEYYEDVIEALSTLPDSSDLVKFVEGERDKYAKKIKKQKRDRDRERRANFRKLKTTVLSDIINEILEDVDEPITIETLTEMISVYYEDGVGETDIENINEYVVSNAIREMLKRHQIIRRTVTVTHGNKYTAKKPYYALAATAFADWHPPTVSEV